MVQRKTLQETSNKKAHNTITGIYRAKESQRMILITDQIIEKEKIIVMVTQELGIEK